MPNVVSTKYTGDKNDRLDHMVIVYQIDDHTIYVGVDQFENEDLIKFSGKFMEQTGLVLMWYHADKVSSPHAYIRLHEGEKTPPQNLVQIACQIVKDGSIEGTKKPACDIVFTPATNLAKTKGMNPGQVSFHKRALMGVERAVRKDAKILKSIEKLRSECSLSDLEAELEDLVANKKKSKKKDDWDDAFASDDGDFDEWGDPKPKKNAPAKKETLFGSLPKAEFNPNMEDDFM